MNASYVGENPTFEKQYLTGQINLNMIPQGTLAERCRMGSAGIAACYVKAGVGTYVEMGGFPMRLGTDGKSIMAVTKGREKRNFDGRDYLLEEAIRVDFSMVKAFQADKYGNLRFRKTARNFNPDMCGNSRFTVAEVEQIVDEIPPEKVHFPGCFVDKVYISPKVSHKIERLKFRDAGASGKTDSSKKKGKEEVKDTSRLRIAERAVAELKEGMYCNLGIGIPVLVANEIIGKKDVDLQSENGLVGMGPYPLKGKQDPDVINAGKECITEATGCSHNRSSDAFGMMRGLHLHSTMLGSLQVSETGDIANWIIPGQKVKGMGGAMDLVSCGSTVIVVMEHTGPGGSPKILPQCTIPLTGKGCCTKLITEMVLVIMLYIRRRLYLNLLLLEWY
jgi:3-oxoacid CoA-transferase